MKKILLTAIIALAVTSGNLFAADKAAPADKKAAAPEHDCADCPMHKKAAEKKAGDKKDINCPMGEMGKAKKHEGKMCPEQMPGVEKTSKNIDNGVEITMTAKDKETAAKVQKLVAERHSDKSQMNKDCACAMEGAETKVENTADGVKITITGKTPEAAKKIQEAVSKKHAGKDCDCGGKHAGKHAAKGIDEAKAANAAKAAKKCPGGESDKPGKCPKCGMPLEEVKQ